MIDPDLIDEIIVTYQKHGWVLRRVLLSAASGAKLGDDRDPRFGGVAVMDSDVDAAWFSRPPKPGGIAWEIRYLGEPPFALLEIIDESSPDFEDRLQGVETLLRDTMAAKQ